jgi:hypothetical protein
MASAILLNSAAIIIVVGFWAMGVILLYRKLASDERKACDQPSAAGHPRMRIRSSEPAGPEYALAGSVGIPRLQPPERA